LLAAYTYIGGPHGLIHYQQLKNREREYLLEHRKLTAQVVGLEQEIVHLENDPLYVEKVAREQYGFARPGERIYWIITH
jgi:cell division protein FtsB